MQPSEKFTGLGMPVFTAFGWAGEEAAQQYAFSQLQQFAAVLQENLPSDLKAEFAYSGWNDEAQNAYLASTENVEDDVYISFNARPTNLEVQLALTDQEAISRALKQIVKQPQDFLLMVREIDPQWSLRIQQIQVDKESGEQAHYQEVFKGPIAELNEDNIVEIVEKAEYLNSDSKWVTPIYLSMRIPAEQVAAMQNSIIPVLTERLGSFAPIVTTLRGRPPKNLAGAQAGFAGVDEPAAEPVIPIEVLEQPEKPLSNEEFTYVSELRPLHIQRGFINMTPEYWPFFAINARTESRPVITIADDVRDEESFVWRLQPTDQARLVFGPKMHGWLADNFVAGEYVQLITTKVNDTEIQIVLEPLS